MDGKREVGKTWNDEDFASCRAGNQQTCTAFACLSHSTNIPFGGSAAAHSSLSLLREKFAGGCIFDVNHYTRLTSATLSPTAWHSRRPVSADVLLCVSNLPACLEPRGERAAALDPSFDLSLSDQWRSQPRHSLLVSKSIHALQRTGCKHRWRLCAELQTNHMLARSGGNDAVLRGIV